VRDLETLEELLNVPQQFLVKFPGIFGGGEEEHLNFFELVDSEYALGVPPVRSGLFSKTWTDPCITQWQLRLIDNIVVVKR